MIHQRQPNLHNCLPKLEAEALAVWLDLVPVGQRHYNTAKEKIEGQMSPVRFVPLEEFHARKLLPGDHFQFMYTS